MESFELPGSLPGCYFRSAGDTKRAGPEAAVTADVRPLAGSRSSKRQSKPLGFPWPSGLARRSRIMELEGTWGCT